MRNYAMSTRKLADRNRDLQDECESQDEGDTQLLLLALRELIDRLAEGAEAQGIEIEEEEEIERWEGGGYVYLEAALTTPLEAEVEVSIQGGRAFIRMAR
jgi:hypothetical protein